MEKLGKLLVKYYPVYLSGLWGTLWISAVTVLFGALLGVLVALMRMSRFQAPAGHFQGVYRGPAGHAHFAPALLFLDRPSQAGPL
ncbi:MAG: hypothetical protein V8R27_01225 [Oscillospiraceae bacterium]